MTETLTRPLAREDDFMRVTRRLCAICGERSYDVAPGLARFDDFDVVALDRCRNRAACARRATARTERLTA